MSDSAVSAQLESRRQRRLSIRGRLRLKNVLTARDDEVLVQLEETDGIDLMTERED